MRRALLLAAAWLPLLAAPGAAQIVLRPVMVDPPAEPTPAPEPPKAAARPPRGAARPAAQKPVPAAPEAPEAAASLPAPTPPAETPAAKPTPAPAPAPAPARTPPRAQVDDQPEFGRLTLPAARGAYRLRENGSQVTVDYPRGTQLAPSGAPRNAAASWERGRVRLTLQAGARLRSRVDGGALVLDILDPPAPAQAAAPATPTPPPPPPQPPVAVAAAPPALVPVPPPVPAPVPADAAPPPAAPPPAATAPPAEAAALPRGPRLEAVAAAEPTLLVPADASVGLAAFRVGVDLMVVLDAAMDLQPATGLDPAFGRIVSQRNQDATVLRIPAAGGLRLARHPRGWLVTLARPTEAVGVIVPRPMAAPATAIRLAASEPSRVVTVLDPQTGGRLLVGTQTAAGEAMPEERLLVQFRLLATFQGVAAAATSDDIGLKREGAGFTLHAGPYAGGRILADSDKAGGEVPELPPQSTLFDLPRDSVQGLARRLAGQVRAAADSPALARSTPRLAVAETMVALGMGVEAQSVLEIAAAEDPALRDQKRPLALAAVAAMLAQRLDAAEAINDPRLTGTMEVALWRAWLRVMRDQAGPAEARVLAAAGRMLLGYPAPLRDRLLPEALAVMAQHGQAEVAGAVMRSRPQDRDLDLPRAMAMEAAGQVAEALTAYDALSVRSARLPRYKAMVRAVELRMQAGQLDARTGADALDQALFGWRGAQQELKLRFRIAALRRQSGQWAEALTVLRDGRGAFPEEATRVDNEIGETFAALFGTDAADQLPPAAFVALYDQNLDLVRAMAWTGPIGARLAARLIALGLQGRAEPVLARLLATSRDPVERSVLGTQLASLRLTLDNPAGAIAALAETAPPPAAAAEPGVMEARQLLYARAESERGNKDTALAMLAQLDTAEAAEIRADIHTSRRDWPQVIASLAALEGKRIAAAAPLDAGQQALVLRLAEAATLAQDDATLARLAERYAAAMQDGPNAVRFRLMTSAPVRSAADLPRAFEEIAAARRLRGELAPAGTAASRPGAGAGARP